MRKKFIFIIVIATMLLSPVTMASAFGTENTEQPSAPDTNTEQPKEPSEVIESATSPDDQLQSTPSVKLTLITKDRVPAAKRFDIREAANQKLYGYDTVQGACSYKGYGYFALYNRNVEKIKIAKVRLKDMKVVKVSKVLGTSCHGNTLTYNPRTNKIVICCGKGGKKKLAIVNASTLKLAYTKTVNISSRMIGGTYSGISGIAYNYKKNMYVAKLRGSSNKVVLLDKNFKPKKYVKIQGNRSYLLSQGIYSEGNYMYDLQSFKGNYKYNLITKRTLSGKLVKRIVIPSNKTGQLFELENLFHDGGRWYISFYRANVKKSGDTDRKNYLYEVKM